MSQVKSKEIRVALARSGIYRTLSEAFLYPEEELFSRVQTETFGEELRACVCMLFEECRSTKSWGRLGEIVDLGQSWNWTASGASLEDMQTEHRGIFGHTISKECPPYETEYGNPHIFQQTQEMGDISGFYRAFGLERSEEAKDRLDHISVELEFMYFLTYKAAYALEHHGAEQVEICQEAQRKFLQEHLSRWAPLFVRRLGEKAERGFYQELAVLTGDFLAFEAQLLGVESEEIRPSQTVPSEAEEMCAICDNTE